MTTSADVSQPFVTFNVWNAGNANIGHCSISYGERDSKKNESWSKYHAIQPDWSFIPFPVFPIPGRPITQFKTDCDLESNYPENPRMPDRYTFPITPEQLRSIDTYATQSQQDISAGRKFYTYLPNCPLNGRVFSSLANLSYDDMPMSNDLSSDNKRAEYSHCVGETRHVAENILGFNLSRRRPWYISTPNTFGQDIERIAKNTPGAEIEKSSYVPTIEEELNAIPPC